MAITLILEKKQLPYSLIYECFLGKKPENNKRNTPNKSKLSGKYVKIHVSFRSKIVNNCWIFNWIKVNVFSLFSFTPTSALCLI